MDIKGCICPFTKWQIHLFISKGTVYRLKTSIPSFPCEFDFLFDEYTMMPRELIVIGDFNLIIGDPSSVPEVKLARDRRSFSYTQFKEDLCIKLIKIPLKQDPNTLFQHYELAGGSALDIQAPIKSMTIKCHLWYNASIHLAKEIRRADENKWRSTKLEVHRKIYVEHRENVNAMIKQPKMDYHESEFTTGKHDTCFRVIKELTQVPGRMLPEASCTKKLCDDLSMFSSEKSANLRQDYDPVSCYGYHHH